MKGTSRIRLLEELGWKEMKMRRSINKLIHYFKIVISLTPSYLRELLPTRVFERTRFPLRSAQNFTPLFARTERYKESFFPSTTKL